MFSDPVSNLKQLGLSENAVVADLGAGTGYYSVAAGGIASRGKVYAVEVQKEFLPTIKDKAREAGLRNVECLWGDVERPHGTKIGDHVADAVIASNILFQIENREEFLNEIMRILKPGGRVLLVDWSDASSSMGASLKNLVPKNKAKELFEQKGFVSERDIDAGAHHYGMILKKER